MSSFPSEAFRNELMLDPDVIYMNAGTSGPQPRWALQAQQEHMAWFNCRGPGSFEVVKRSVEVEREIRQALARFFGGHPRQYALTQSTSEGINIVLNSLPWEPGDEIVTTDLEHGGLALPVYHRAKTAGLGLKIMRLPEEADALEAFEAVLTPRTRLLALSHISYCDGRRLPLERLVERAHAAGVAVLVDAAQSAGQIPLRWEHLDADFVAAPGQKWLLGPEGTGTLYMHGDRARRLTPDRVGWAGELEFDRDGGYRLKSSAAKCELGTKDPAALIGWLHSLRFLESYGMEAIAERIRELSDTVREGLSQIPSVRILGSTQPEEGSGLIAFNVGTLPPPRVVMYLQQLAGIVARWIPEPHPPAVRVSLHAHITDRDVETLLAAVRVAERNVDPSPLAVPPFFAEWDQ